MTADEQRPQREVLQLLNTSRRPLWLPRENLRGVNLRGVNLRGANLRDAILVDSDLRMTDLSSANLYGSDLTNARLENALYTLETTWPEDFNPTDAGAVLVKHQHQGWRLCWLLVCLRVSIIVLHHELYELLANVRQKYHTHSLFRQE